MLSQKDTKLSKIHHPEVADVFRCYREEYAKIRAPPREQIKVMQQIVSCRTSAMGGHIQKCDECDYEQNAYNSCRNRHCPKNARQWPRKNGSMIERRS